jgi:hypothetical protein
VEGGSIAHARDTHYHNPPDYLVIEPENTSTRTRNLQQTNTNGYKWQGTPEKLAEAQKIVESWGTDGKFYKPTPEYQGLLRQLLNRYNYRPDTNFAKIDRIVHPEIEQFKQQVYNMMVEGLTVRKWQQICSSKNEARVEQVLKDYLNLTEETVDKLVQ